MSTTNVLLAAAMYRGTVTQVTVQASVVPGIGIHVVGLPDELVAEMLLRVISAIQAAGYIIPGRKIVIYISALGRNAGKHERIVTGALAIDGTIRAPFTGFGSTIDAAAVLDEYLRQGFHDCIGWADAVEASDMNIWRGYASLAEIIEDIKNQTL